MTDLIICEICGQTFQTTSNTEICNACQKGAKKTDKNTKAAQALRKTAKGIGAKALKGTAKQKKWGESLRLDFINSAKDLEAVKVLVCSASLETAKFWIENRDNNNLESELVEILEITKKLNAGEDADAGKRNELIKKLGI